MLYDSILGNVDTYLVTNVRLGRVQGPTVVTNVLGRKEDPKGQAVEKVARAQEARHGAQAKLRVAL